MTKIVAKARTYPVKNFFVSMLTKDISLQDCILDLLDNCLDGAARHLRSKNGDDAAKVKYEGYWAELTLRADNFAIRDNCGGISITDASEYAFHFGRRPDAPRDADYSIGLYGIGMKRAFFKIGNAIHMHSSTGTEAFDTSIDVQQWVSDDENWDFDLYESSPGDTAGTAISIEKLNPDVGDEFDDKVFLNRLVETIARDYSFFLQDGFKVVVNETPVTPYQFKLKQSEDFEPLKTTYVENPGETNPITVTISAGMAAPPPEDEFPDAREYEAKDYYGWFVSCNRRIVLAGDKTDKTVWGNEGFPRWHQQYYGFMGMIDFSSSDPNRLPWDTTKRDLELNDRIYRRALVTMKEATKKYIDYTNQRKDSLEEAKAKETMAQAVPIESLPPRPKMKLPFVERKPKIKLATIQYKRPEEEVRKIAGSLGDAFMSNKDVGILTYEYYLEHEIEE